MTSLVNGVFFLFVFLSKHFYYYTSYLFYIPPVTRPAAFVLQTWTIPQNMWLVEERCAGALEKQLDIQ